MKVGYVLLAHETPNVLYPLLKSILITSSNVYLHYDGDLENLKSYLKSKDIDISNLFFAEQVSVEWGEWSIVQATLNCLEVAKFNGFPDDSYYLISGSCYPIKPSADLSDFLDKNYFDYIECVDAKKVRWVTDGYQNERWSVYSFFNWRKTPKIFDLSIKIQKALGVKRSIPSGLKPKIGSQWWCLRKTSIIKVLDFIEKNPCLLKFYSKVWIPDECFFQTLVGNLIDSSEINNNLLTYYNFNERGEPNIFYNDSYIPVNDRFFFIRKVSPDALDLKENLHTVFNGGSNFSNSTPVNSSLSFTSVHLYYKELLKSDFVSVKLTIDGLSYYRENSITFDVSDFKFDRFSYLNLYKVFQESQNSSSYVHLLNVNIDFIEEIAYLKGVSFFLDDIYSFNVIDSFAVLSIIVHSKSFLVLSQGKVFERFLKEKYMLGSASVALLFTDTKKSCPGVSDFENYYISKSRFSTINFYGFSNLIRFLNVHDSSPVCFILEFEFLESINQYDFSGVDFFYKYTNEEISFSCPSYVKMIG